MKIAIEVPLLTHVAINGSGDIRLSDVTKDTLALVINGSGDITAQGQVDELTADINGSGDLHAATLEAKAVQVKVNGSGDAEVKASDTFKASINGSGDIVYIGAPARVQTAVHGSGTIIKK